MGISCFSERQVVKTAGCPDIGGLGPSVTRVTRELGVTPMSLSRALPAAGISRPRGASRWRLLCGRPSDKAHRATTFPFTSPFIEPSGVNKRLAREERKQRGKRASCARPGTALLDSAESVRTPRQAAPAAVLSRCHRDRLSFVAYLVMG